MSKRLTSIEFIERAIDKHGDVYSYPRVDYINAKTKVIITCPIHGDFEQLPFDHLSGKGCRSCKYEKWAKQLKDNKQTFIEKARTTHNDLYSYDNVKYIDSFTKISIVCKKHGEFLQTPNNHISNSAGCPSCKSDKLSIDRRSTTDEFINKANLKHNKKYDYSNTTYTTAHSKIKIRCLEHGEFGIIANDHLNGRGCQKCSKKNYPEDFIENILKNNNINFIKNDRSVIKPLELDFVLPDHKIAIEYHGHYYHSDIAGKNKTYHLNKTLKAEKQGYRVIQIFEAEFVKNKILLESKLKNLLHLNKYKIYARNCVIKEITSQEKKKFNEKYHIQGDSQSFINLGLFNKGRLVQVMTFSKRRKAMGGKHNNNEYELCRVSSIKNFNIIGGSSKILKYFEKTYNPTKIISYADRRWSIGDVYRKMGFNLTRISKPNYWYFHKSNTKKIYHRYKFAKHTLAEQLENFDSFSTEWENMINNGYDRIWDCGNYVFEKTY